MLPSGAPVRSKPPWNLQRPEVCVEVRVQGVPAGVRAPQMRRFSRVSVSLTSWIQSGVQDFAWGVPCVVVSLSM